MSHLGQYTLGLNRFSLIRSPLTQVLLLTAWLMAGNAFASLTETQAVESAELAPLPEHEATTRHILKALRERHYLYQLLDDESSELIFDEYLTALDPSKSYFSVQDIRAFEPYRRSLDNALRRGDLSPAFSIFNAYQNQITQRLTWVVSQLEQGVEQYQFDVDETLELDRSEAPWAQDDAALDDLWRRRLKNDVLNLKLADKDLADIADLLRKRYQNRLNRAQQTRSDDVYQVFINALAKTYDPHTQYFSPTTAENFNINMSLSLEGIGAVLSSEDEYTQIVSLVPAGPADKTKALKPNDRITAVGQGDEGEMVDVIGWRLDDVVQLIRGKKDTIVRLEVLPANAVDGFSSKLIPIVRNKVELEEQSAQSKIIEVEEYGSTRRIGVIEIPTFYVDFQALQDGDENYRSTTRDVKRLLKDLESAQVDAVVIDLRDNGGGSLQEAKTLTGLFIDRGPTVQIRSKSDRVDVLTDRDYRVEYAGPIAVLVNRLSASASEIFAGAIQDYGRGLVIGTQTFGKGTVQTLQPLLRGQLKMTQAKFYRISGESTQHRGIIPDIAYPVDYDPETIGESTLDRPLVWDKITPAVYRPKGDVVGFLPTLSKRHQTRMQTNPEFQYITSAYNYRRVRREVKAISLNETTRREEQAIAKTFWLNLTNEKRVAQGLPVIADLDELEATETLASEGDVVDPLLPPDTPIDAPIKSVVAATSEAAGAVDALDRATPEASIGAENTVAGNAEADEPPAEETPEASDAYVVEAGHILADLISLRNQTATQSSTAAPS
ncbi:MAG: carboxy terminal-processing peptidase [Pseudomonadales bacterium]|nr:carboxy terminal-processing peptidase [Pseudomonadales bacterium]